jgi:ABC-2 type transport system ATP-binding protein
MTTVNATGYAVETAALTKRYGRRTALSGIDLRIETGSVFGVIGPNGAGKTTTMRLLLDVIRPTSGDIRVLGVPPRLGGPALRRRIGYLPGELRLETRVKGREFLRHLERLSGPVAPGTVERLAERLDVDLGRPVRSLSKGNKQKIGLIQAFMHEPRLLVLDEPTSGLDPLVQQEFLAMVREARDRGQTIFLSSHVLSEIEQAADAVAILRAGEVVAVSTVERLRQQALRHLRIGVEPREVDALRAALSRLPGLALGATSQVDGVATLHATLEGAIGEFVRALASHTILDLVVQEPDLEESVLRFYRPGEATDAGAGTEGSDR